MIRIDNLRKYYGNFKAVDGISFDVAKGEILGFLGPNGAGKSTTMKVITGYYPPTDGTVNIGGLDVVENSLEVRKMIGYLPETNPLYLELTVLEYLEHIAEMRQIEKNLRYKRIREMSELTGLVDRFGQPIGQLSKGFKQRVGLTQAMLHDPKILILDEPTIGLDPNQIIEIRSLIKRIGEEKTVILSTHILPEVQATCDRVVIINKGTLVADGTPKELQDQFQGLPVIEIEIRGDNCDDGSPFEAISGIKKVERVNDPEPNVCAWRISSNSLTDARADIFHICVNKGWTLLRMNREVQSLEHIFQQLTQTHPVADAEVAA